MSLISLPIRFCLFCRAIFCLPVATKCPGHQCGGSGWSSTVVLRILLSLQGSGITDDPAYKAIVVRVSAGAQAFLQSLVKVMFAGSRKRPLRHVNSQPSQSRGGDEHQQREV